MLALCSVIFCRVRRGREAGYPGFSGQLGDWRPRYAGRGRVRRGRKAGYSGSRDNWGSGGRGTHGGGVLVEGAIHSLIKLSPVDGLFSMVSIILNGAPFTIWFLCLRLHSAVLAQHPPKQHLHLHPHEGPRSTVWAPLPADAAQAGGSTFPHFSTVQVGQLSNSTSIRPSSSRTNF